MDNKNTQVHFMGIGGSGASSVARIAKAAGFEVSGCDLVTSRMTRDLEREGIPVEIGHNPAHLQNVDILAHTPAVLYQNLDEPEYQLAVKQKKAMIWEEFMAKFLLKDKFIVAVAGTHGKGTTTAMLGRILETAGWDPTVEVGANLLDWNRQNFRVGKSKYFVLEADEYREKFLLYKSNLLVITSIEMDHPDYFKNFEAVMAAFRKLVLKMAEPQVLVINREDRGCLELLKELKKLKFKGKIIPYDPLKLKPFGPAQGGLKLKLLGEHVRSDASGAAEAAKALGVKDADIKKGLEGFGGLERRFEYRGEIEGVKVYDDYAHHPTAVAVNIQAARELFPKKQIWVVLEPHMFSRLKTLFSEFVEVLKTADRVIVTDVYSKREQDMNKPSGKDLTQAIASTRATYVGGGVENVVNFVKRNTSKGDVVLVMGAGDSYRIAEELVGL